MRTRISAASVLVASLTVACGPPVVRRLTVEPVLVCQGDRVTVSWETSGGGTTLYVMPAQRATTSMDVASSNSTTFNIHTTTHFRVTVGGGGSGSASKDADAFVSGGPQDSSAAGTATCDPGTRTAEVFATVTANPRSLRVESIATNRPMTVSHEGRTAEVGPLGTPVFRDTAVEGVWHLRIPLFDGENCASIDGAPLAEIQYSLAVRGFCPAELPGGSSVRVPPSNSDGVGLPPGWQSCGREGERCCAEGTCHTGLGCYQLECRRGEPAQETTCSGELLGTNWQWYIFGCKDEWGCATIVQPRVRANSPDEAAACVANACPSGTTLAQTFVARTDIPFQVQVTEDSVCETVFPNVFDEADARSCAQHIWCEAQECARLEPGRCPE